MSLHRVEQKKIFSKEKTKMEDLPKIKRSERKRDFDLFVPFVFECCDEYGLKFVSLILFQTSNIIAYVCVQMFRS